MQFYVLDRRNRFTDREFAYGEEITSETGDWERCPSCDAAVSSRRVLPPHEVTLSKTQYGDFVLGTFETFLVSERVRDLYLQSGLKGITNFEAVEVKKVVHKRKTSPNPPNYYLAYIGRDPARIDQVHSNIVYEDVPTCHVCFQGIIRSFDGVYLVPDTWGGSDIFFPVGLSGTILVSQRFCNFVQDNHFTNVQLVPADAYQPSWNMK